MSYFFFTSLSIIIYSIFFNLYLNQFFAKKLNLYDLPNKNKIHNIKTPLTGGIYFISIIIISFIIDLFFNAEPLKEKIYFLLISLSVFIVGFADDKLDVKALNRIIVLFIIFSVSFSIHDSLKIEIIKFILVNSEDKVIFYRNFDTTILSAALLVTFISIINISDGLNGLVLIMLIGANSILFIYNPNLTTEILLVLVAGIAFLILNLKGKAFLGSSGNIILSLLTYSNIVKVYNQISPFDLFTVFIIFIVPTLDLIRLFFVRIIRNINPFQRDLEHIHYLIFKKNKNYYLFIYTFIVFLPFTMHYCIINNALISIPLSIIIYFFTIFYFKNQSK